MKQNVNKAIKYCLAILIGLSCFTSLASNSNVLAKDEINIKETITYSEDKSRASIALDTKSIGELYTISDIIQPDGSKMDLTNPMLAVTQNGTYVFKVSYTNKADTSEEPAQQSFDKEVVVDGIGTTQTPPTTPDAQAQAIGRSVVTNGGVTIDTPGYVDATGLDNASIMTMNITVDFSNDNTTDGKTLEVTLPEGLRFIQIPVAGTYSKTGVDANLLAPYPSSDPLSTAITTVTLPKQEASPMSQTFGKVTYTFDKGTKKATLSFQVRGDNKRYYKAMKIPNPITAVGYMGGSQVGSASQTINVYGYQNGNGTFNIYGNDTTSTQLMASTPTEKSYGYSQTNQLSLFNNASPLDTRNRYVKSAVYYLYYPQGTTYESYSGPTGTIVNDTANSRIILTVPAWSSSVTTLIKYSVPEGTPDGVYANKAKDYVEIEFYDGTRDTKILTGGIYSVEITSILVNKLSLTLTSGGNYDDTVDSTHYKYAGFFNITNNATGGVKTNQVAHFEFGANWHVRKVNLPFDTSIVGNTIKDIQYKTNKNPSWRTFVIASPSDLESVSSTKMLTATQVGLASDEYFTEVSANMGSFRIGYNSGTQMQNTVVNSFGQLTTGVSSEVIKFSMYDASDPSNTMVTKSAIVQNSGSVVKTTVTNSSASILNASSSVPITQIPAGSPFIVKSTIDIHAYPYGTTTALKAPEIYLREPIGMTLDVDSVVIKDKAGLELTDWTYTTHTNSFGETIYIIKTSSNTIIGAYFGDLATSKYINIQYTMNTSVKVVGAYDTRDLIGLGKSGVTPIAPAGTGAAAIPRIDTYDFNGNGNTTEYMLTTSSKAFSVIANKNVLVETFLSIAGETPKAPYVDGIASTVSYFTPGTDADYTVQITNNGDGPASSFDSYIPIPKTGTTFGSAFQNSPFAWDATLSSAVVLDAEAASTFQVLYSSDATASNYNTTAVYSATPPANLKDVRMVKIAATNPIPAGATANIKVPLKVDETFDTANTGNKIGTKNIYNPVYDVTSETFSGTMPGTKVGSELVIAQMSGIAFQDMDGDGLFDATKTDTLLSGIKVDLYKWDSVSSTYKTVFQADGTTPVSTTTDSSGHYLFDYTVGMNYGNYAVHFNEKTGGIYQYTINVANKTNNSSAIISGAQKGWAINVDPTKPAAQNINVGYLAYNPPVDLSATINTPNGASVKVGNTLTLTSSVLPTALWPTIQDPTTPYTWSFVTPADASKATLAPGANGTLVITPSTLASGTTTFAVALSVKDVYGTTKTTSPVTITVISNVAPVVTAPTLSVYVGDSINLLSGVSATNNMNAAITLTIAPGVAGNTTIDDATLPVAANKYTTAGTYQVNISVSDVYGNTKVQPRLIQVNDKPSVVATTQVYNVGDTNILNGVTTNATASWMKAPAAVGSAVATPITGSAQATAANNKISYSVAGPSIDFSVVGMYNVTYVATDPNGHTGTSTVSVAVVPVSLSKENSASVDASNFTIAYASVAGITLDSVKTSANALGFTYTYVDGVLTAVNQVTMSDISIDTTQFNNIKAVTKAGGIYPLTYRVTSGSDTASKSITVTVTGTGVVIENGLTISANDVVLDNNEAASFDQATVLSKANVNAIVTLSGEVVSDLSVNVTQLAAINAATSVGGVFDLNITAQATIDGNLQSVSKTIKVTVKGSGVVSENKLTISASDFTLEHADAETLDDAQAKILSNVIAIVSDSGETVTNIKVDATQLTNIKNAPTTGGIYNLALTATHDVDGVSQSVSKTIKVSVKGSGLVVENGISLYAVDFALEHADAKNITEAIAKDASHANVSAIETISGAVVSNVTMDAAQLLAIKNAPRTGGIYDLTITASAVLNGTAQTTTKIIKVSVKGSGVIVQNGITLSAKNVILEHAAAAAFNEAQAKNLSQVRAMVTNTGANVATISVNAAQLSLIQAAGKTGGVFDLNFEASETINGTLVSANHNIQVVVKGSAITIDNNIVLNASNFTIEHADAKNITEAIAKDASHANVRAFEVETSTPITNIVVDSSDLLALQEAPKQGGIYNVRITATSADTLRSTMKTIKVTVKGTGVVVENGITLVANPFAIEKDQANTLTQAQALSNAGTSAIVTETGEVLTDLSVDATQLAAIKAATSVGGIYDLAITAKAILGGSPQSVSKTIKVSVKGSGVISENGITLSAQNFAIENEDAATLNEALIKNASHANVKAIEVQSGASISDVSIDATQLASIKQATLAGGVYNLTITATATINGTTQSVSKVIVVSVKGSGIVIEDGLSIQALPFTMDNDSAKTMTSVDASTKAKVLAFNMDGVDITSKITVDAAQLKAINETTTLGGIYPLTYHVVDGSNAASITIQVVVFAQHTVIDPSESLSISATGFSVPHASAATLSDQDVVAMGNVAAYHFQKDTNDVILSIDNVTVDVSVNAAQLAAIQAAPTMGGVYSLTYSISKGTATVSKTIQVFVKSIYDVSDGDENISIGATSFVLQSSADAQQITRSSILEKAKARAIKVEKTVDGTVLSYEDITSTIELSTDEINKVKTTPNNGGVYSLTLVVKATIDGNEVVASKTIQVVVLPQGYVGSEDGTLGLSGKGFVIGYQNLDALTNSEVLNKASAKAFAFTLDENGEIISATDVSSTITVDEMQLASIKATTKAGATLPLTLRVSKDGVDVEKEIEVVVLPMGGDVSEDNTLSLAAQGFSVANKEAASLDQASALLQASALAQRIEYDVDGDITGTTDLSSSIVVDEAQLVAIQNATIKGGLFDLTYTITNQGESLSETIQVLVKAANEVSDASQSLTLGASGFVLANSSDAKALSETSALKNAQAVATKTLKNADGDILGYQDVSSNITLNATQLKAIQAATSVGGVYKLDVHVSDHDITLTKTIIVVVVGSATPTPVNGIAMSAHDATMAYADAIKAKDSDIVRSTDAVAYVVESGEALQIQIDASNLSKVNKAKQVGEVVDVTLQATSNHPWSRAIYTNAMNVKITVEKDPTYVTPVIEQPTIDKPIVKPQTPSKQTDGVRTSDTTAPSFIAWLMVSFGFVVVGRSFTRKKNAKR